MWIIALLPDIETQKTIINSIDKINTPRLQKVGENGSIPHVSLLHANFKDLKAIRERVQQINIKLPINSKIINISYQERGWYFLNLSKEELIKAHIRIFDKLKDLIIAPSGNEIDEKPQHYSSSEYFYFLNYGYRYINECYHPHLTLGRSNNDYNKELHTSIDNSIQLKEINFNKLVIGKKLQNGQLSEYSEFLVPQILE